MAAGSRPSLWRPSVFAVTWQVCTWLGCGLVGYSVWVLSPAAWVAMGLPMVMITVVVLLSELRPIVMTRLPGNPVSISLAFVFATLFVWGLYPALVLQAAAVVLSEIVARKPVWKVLFNVGQYSISVTAAWLVMRSAGVAPTPTSPNLDLTAGDLGWVLGSWVVYHLVNLALVAGLADSTVGRRGGSRSPRSSGSSPGPRSRCWPCRPWSPRSRWPARTRGPCCHCCCCP